jgi:hypothetical protein
VINSITDLPTLFNVKERYMEAEEKDYRCVILERLSGDILHECIVTEYDHLHAQYYAACLYRTQNPTQPNNWKVEVFPL